MQSPADVLRAMCRSVTENTDITDITMDAWFGEAEVISLTADAMVIRVPSEFVKETIMGRYHAPCEEALEKLFSCPISLIVLTPEEAAEELPPAARSVQDGYTFENFIVGESNRLAHAAALAVASMPAKQYNPLFIYGGSGLGKTHLLRAISSTIRRAHPSMRILYIKGDDFTNELISCIQTQRMDEFHSKYRQADVLLLDDIQFIAGKEQTQVEFFHTFNSLYDAGKQIILSSDRPPHEIATLHERLQTRFAWGLMADIKTPDIETRAAILRQKTKALELEIDDELLLYVAKSLKGNIRQLEGVVNRIKASRDLIGAPVDREMIKRVIDDLGGDIDFMPTPDSIVAEVCRYYSISPELLRSKNRHKEILFPRQIASYLMRNHTELSLPEIGRVLGGQHYTTIINSIDAVTLKMRGDSGLANSIKDLEHNITEH